MENRPLDLSSEDERRSSFHLPMRTAILIAVFLSVAGIMIAAILPELLKEGTNTENDPYSTPLSILLSSTVDQIEVNEKDYSDLSIPVAYYILLSETSSNMSGTDSITSGYIDFLLGDDTPYIFTVSSGQGWDTERSHVVSSSDNSDKSSTSTSQTVVVDLKDGQEITLNFQLKVWEVEDVIQ